MWLFTPRGFFSVVAHRDDPGLVLVRARAHEDLRKLTGVLGQIDILETPDGDYRWRTTVTRRAWTGALVLLAAEIDYPNFKSEVAERQGSERAAAYGRVWSVMHELQERTARRRRG